MRRLVGVCSSVAVASLVSLVTLAGACAAWRAPNDPGIAVVLGPPETLGLETRDPDADMPGPVLADAPDVPLNEALVGSPEVAEDYGAPVPPPEPLPEEAPPQPAPGTDWIGGYWWWTPPLGRYAWVTGAWRRPPPGLKWTPGSWNASAGAGGKYLRTPGTWGSPAVASVVSLSTPPPFPENETYGLAPGPEYVWKAGSYVPKPTGDGYAWTPGAWARPPSLASGARVGLLALTWVPARSVGSGGRYYYQPGRWDYPVEHRGVAYLPDLHGLPGSHAAVTPVVAPASLVSAHARYLAASGGAVARKAVVMTAARAAAASRVAAEEAAHEAASNREAASGGRPIPYAAWDERNAPFLRATSAALRPYFPTRILSPEPRSESLADRVAFGAGGAGQVGAGARLPTAPGAVPAPAAAGKGAAPGETEPGKGGGREGGEGRGGRGEARGGRR